MLTSASPYSLVVGRIERTLCTSESTIFFAALNPASVRFDSATTPGEVLGLAQAPPLIHMTQAEGISLLQFLDHQSGAPRSAIRRLNGRAWIPPRLTSTILGSVVMGLSATRRLFMGPGAVVQCAGGQTLKAVGGNSSFAYTHFLPAFVDRVAAPLIPQ